MSQQRYDPYNHLYQVGDLVVYKGHLLDGPDEVGVITKIMSMLHDSMDVIYEVMTANGMDIVTHYDAQFILVPLWVHVEARQRRETVMDELRKFTKIAEGDEA
jgi:hypothetical protein